MTANFLLTIKSARGVTTGHTRYATVSQALQSAKALLSDGAPSVWIIDNEGHLILPADQVRLRLTAVGSGSDKTRV